MWEDASNVYKLGCLLQLRKRCGEGSHKNSIFSFSLDEAKWFPFNLTLFDYLLTAVERLLGRLAVHV